MEEEFSFRDYSTFERNGKTRPISEYKESLKEEITINKKLKVGDRVKLKVRNYEVVVTHVDYYMQGVGVIAYIGERTDEEHKGELAAFEQYDIEEIISSKKTDKEPEKKEYEGEEL